RKPAKLPGPALPVSIQVVTPLVRQNSLASMPSDVPPQYTCEWRSIRPGATMWPDTSRTSVPALPCKVWPDLGDFAGGKADVGGAVQAMRRVDDPPALQDQIERHSCLLRRGHRLGLCDYSRVEVQA